MFHAKIFPTSVSFILTGVHVSCPYLGAETENVNLATIVNLRCFNLYLFGLLSLSFLLLDNSSWMRVGDLSGGLDIEDGDPPTRKKGGVKLRKANLVIRIMYGVISNEPIRQMYFKK